MSLRQSSRTAEYMAFFRALETARPAKRRLFTDPFARHFLRPSLQRFVRLSQFPILRNFISGYVDRRFHGARTAAIARTIFIDEALRASLKKNIRQVVILGAGFDCRAYRLPEMSAATVFEVDHPSTHAAKLAGLRKLLTEIPAHVRFVEIDFNRQKLPEVLAQANFHSAQPSVFLWEGVTNYLQADAVDAVLHFVASCHPGTRLIFTYIHSGILDGSASFDGADRMIREVANMGEPWTFGFSPEHLPAILRERGLSLREDLSLSECRDRYYGAAVAARMAGYGFYHVAVADVVQASADAPLARMTSLQESSAISRD